MTNNTQLVPSEIAQLQQEVDHLAETTARVRAILIEERARPIPSAAEMEADIKAAQEGVAEVERQLEAVKTEIRLRRQAINAAQREYERWSLAQRINRVHQLEASVKAHLAKIAELEAEITHLHAAQWQATEALELTKQYQSAVQAGVLQLPLEQDPRLAGLETEYRRKKQQLEQMLNKTD